MYPHTSSKSSHIFLLSQKMQNVLKRMHKQFSDFFRLTIFLFQVSETSVFQQKFRQKKNILLQFCSWICFRSFERWQWFLTLKLFRQNLKKKFITTFRNVFWLEDFHQNRSKKYFRSKILSLWRYKYWKTLTLFRIDNQ